MNMKNSDLSCVHAYVHALSVFVSIQVIRSIGYKSLPLVSDGSAPFDHKAGVVPSTQGRVTGFPGECRNLA